MGIITGKITVPMNLKSYFIHITKSFYQLLVVKKYTNNLVYMFGITFLGLSQLWQVNNH